MKNLTLVIGSVDQKTQKERDALGKYLRGQASIHAVFVKGKTNGVLPIEEVVDRTFAQQPADLYVGVLPRRANATSVAECAYAYSAAVKRGIRCVVFQQRGAEKYRRQEPISERDIVVYEAAHDLGELLHRYLFGDRLSVDQDEFPIGI